MPVEFDAIAAWTLVAECPIPNDIGPILVPGEQPYVAYKTFRDSAIFTDRRLIVRDSQGITGKKVELYPCRTPASTCGPRRTPVISTITPRWSCGPAPATSRSSSAAGSMSAVSTTSSPRWSSTPGDPNPRRGRRRLRDRPAGRASPPSRQGHGEPRVRRRHMLQCRPRVVAHGPSPASQARGREEPGVLFSSAAPPPPSWPRLRRAAPSPVPDPSAPGRDPPASVPAILLNWSHYATR